MRLQRLFATALLLQAAAALPAAAQGAQKPDEDRFTPVVLVPGGELDEPLSFEVARDGRVFIQERKGAVKLYDPATKSVKLVGTLRVNRTYIGADGQTREAEEGLVGLTLDPDFEQNRWIYLLYAHPTVAKHVLSRFVVEGDSLVSASEKVVLEFDVQRETCCHTGGGMFWDREGNLWITVGNNTGNVTGSQTDQRAGRENWDDQRGASNTADLRGKILRIRPQPDGSYTIPEGNLFRPGTPGTRPEIYIMGTRNAWRVSRDSRTGYVYWGEVGPDAAADAPNTVRGEDEFNQARGPGYFGWPYFVGENRAYPITDYATGNILPPKDPARPINDSRHNTGLRELPPAQPAFISYPYAISEKYPELGTGGRCAVGGPIFRRGDFASGAARVWPSYYEGKWIAADCARNWIMSIGLDANSSYAGMERFLADYVPIEPMDLKFGPDGDLYVLEYGSTWFAKSPDSKLVRVEYNAGNRAPDVEISSSSVGGTVPLRVTLSSAGTRDPDNDALRYEWRITSPTGGAPRTFTTATPEVTFDRPGAYTARLTVRDPSGATATDSVRIVAGNEPPRVAVDVTRGNKSFFFPGQPIEYLVHVTDREDGTVSPERVALSIDYVPENFDVAALAQGDRPVDADTRFAVPNAIMSTTDCRACHQLDVRSAGPSWREISRRYQGDAEAVSRLVNKIRQGGSGVWGEINMPAHPALSTAESTALVHYILGTANANGGTLPLSGSYTPVLPQGDQGRGKLLIRAVYTDRGAQGGLPSQTSERVLVLRGPMFSAGTADTIHGAETRYNRNNGTTSVIARAGSFIAFRGVDLTGIRRAELNATASSREGNTGGTIELRLGSPTGELIGQLPVAVSQPMQPGAQAMQNAGAGGQGRAPAGPPMLAAELKPTTGVHDLYLVFRNEQARPIDPLMVLNTIRVVQ